MTGWIIAGAVVLLIVFWYIGTMNKFRRLKIAIEESWAGIDVQLKRKANIIPNLVDALKMQMNFEEKVLTELTAARTGLTSSDRGEAMAASDKISALIPTIRATAENYPQLGTNNSFLQIMSDIRDCEDKITYARNRYNMTTARYNMEIVMIPASIVASQMGLQKEALYEISQTQRDDADNMRISQL
ncbi:MAG: LemA family protein [Lentisphaerae bacterium]|nr:LemA family protein [Lentisphaerota bacterium]